MREKKEKLIIELGNGDVKEIEEIKRKKKIEEEKREEEEEEDNEMELKRGIKEKKKERKLLGMLKGEEDGKIGEDGRSK